jgi:hypothetical protein
MTLEKEVKGNAIHTRQRRQFYKSGWSNGCLSVAYAFGVMAYGDGDLCCSLLYIPKLDFSPKPIQKKRQTQIRAWMKQDIGPTNSEVKKLFPSFQPPIL